MAPLRIREFTDPACPFAFSAEPARLRLRWLYGDQIEWELRMVVLSESPDDYLAKGFTPERQVRALRSRPRASAQARACGPARLPLHLPVVRDRALRRHRVAAIRRARLPACGGVRGGHREPRAGARAPCRTGLGGRGACLGGRAA